MAGANDEARDYTDRVNDDGEATRTLDKCDCKPKIRTHADEKQALSVIHVLIKYVTKG